LETIERAVQLIELFLDYRAIAPAKPVHARNATRGADSSSRIDRAISRVMQPAPVLDLLMNDESNHVRSRFS